MASRPKGFGMTGEIHAKKELKYDEQLAKEAIEWINLLVPTSPRLASFDANSVHEMLKDGVWLCHLANAIKEGSVRKINESKMAFKQMENIGNFLDACYSIGVSKTDLFQTVDLYEKQNMSQVINGLHALGRKAGAMGKPGIGPKESDSNRRDFSDEQLKAGDGVIGLQMGTNKFADQSGQNFGKTRAIID